MQPVKVSPVKAVLEQLRREIVATLQGRGIKVPPEALQRGGCKAAVRAWVRLYARAIPAIPRAVHESPELLARDLSEEMREALATIRGEFERGDDMTARLTRQFYKSAFNDFLFNNFRIHHMHLGAHGAGVDKTRQHTMAGGGDALLFALVADSEAYFVDVLDHDVFKSPKAAELTESLVRVVLRNRPDLLASLIFTGVTSDVAFNDAFHMARSGFTAPFQVDGVCFGGGNVLDGKVTMSEDANGVTIFQRAPCTSIQVVRAANRILNTVVELVEVITHDAESLAAQVRTRTGTRPSELKLEVVEAGKLVVLREQSTGMEFASDGRTPGYFFSFPPTVDVEAPT